MAVANLTVQQPTIPRPDFSWMDGVTEALGGAIDKKSRDFALSRLADIPLSGGTPAQQPATGFLSSLAAPAASSAPQTAPVTPVERSVAQGDTYRPFIDTVRSGGLTNPYGLAAVASTGRAESGWSAKNANRTWSDPSESGQPGTAGGILSWRGPRYQALAATGDLSPEGQAKFFLQENPDLIQKLNSAKSVEEAQQLMNNAWQFAGYNRPGGESARRLAMAQNYYANEFGNAPANAGAAAIEAIAPLEQGDTNGMETAYVDPMVHVVPRQEASLPPKDASAPYTMASPTAPQSRAPMQVADASGRTGLIAQAVTPVQRGSVDPAIIRQLLKDPQLNSIGLELWKANVQGQKANEPWQFVTLPDGTLARANQQSGAIEAVGRFPKDPKAEGLGGSEAGLNLVYGQDAEGNTVAFQPLKGGGVRRVEVPDGIKLTPGISSNDLGTTVVTRNSRTGQVIDTREKDVAGAAEQTADGKARSEAKAALPAIQSASDQMLATIDSLAKDAYLPNMLGPINSRTPNLTSDAARVQSKMDQINGQTFLQAFNALKGGGAITEIEGQKATEAMARLNTAQSVEDYQAALAELRGVVTRGIANARSKASGSTAPAGNHTTSGVKWSIEE
ncbi:hypothetical protein [Agrobacterium tumefaciens]|uniref:hypothetical protein n=1 Tax=Agrobacterium tumefaciens TaxID=358 RepID=UPI0006871299|nr:hypothetical protein [Agrobacterium tumefaciens]